ncbi:MAG TPA: hypothetical protein VHP56_07760 [Solirubrobacterales bacterium]|nr:hypothetical protein [Solirubrobacterales bacterium]
MSSRIHVLLDKIDEHLDEVEEHYEADLASQELSDELVYAIGAVVQDCQRALDWTASAVKRKYVPKRKWKPYFPLVQQPEQFRPELRKQLGDLFEVAPEVAEAIRRHQPYRKGKVVLGYLHKLARVEKHEDFTPQTRDVTRRVEARSAGGVVSWNPDAVTFRGPGVSIGGVPVDPRTQLPVPSPSQTVRETHFVDWRFIDPPVSVLPTLEELARLTGAAVRDVRRKADL